MVATGTDYDLNNRVDIDNLDEDTMRDITKRRHDGLLESYTLEPLGYIPKLGVPHPMHHVHKEGHLKANNNSSIMD